MITEPSSAGWEGRAVVEHVGSKSDVRIVVVPSGVIEIKDWVFQDCKELTSLTLPATCKYIRYRAFDGCSGLTSLILPDNLHTGNYVFARCSGLTSLTLPSTFKLDSFGTFKGCSGLTSVTLPDKLTWICTDSFYGCSGLTSLTLPNTLTRVSRSAFRDCTGLVSMTLPDSLTTLSLNIFRNCTGLTSVVYRLSVSKASFVAWSVGCSRNRSNWQLTSLKQLRNVLRLIVVFTLERRDVANIDPLGLKEVFKGCTALPSYLTQTKQATDQQRKEHKWKYPVPDV